MGDAVKAEALNKAAADTRIVTGTAAANDRRPRPWAA